MPFVFFAVHIFFFESTFFFIAQASHRSPDTISLHLKKTGSAPSPYDCTALSKMLQCHYHVEKSV